MIIGKIWDSDYPWDVRVEKVATSLGEAGHEVHLICRNRRAQPTQDRIGKLILHRMPNHMGAGSRFESLTTFPAFVNPRWARHILSASRAAKVDLLLCRDLPLAPVAIWVGRKLGVPVVMDMAENYPAMMRSLWESSIHKRTDWLVRNPRAAAAVEKWVVERLDHIVVVVDESRDRLVGLGVSPDKITVVGNTPPLARTEVPPIPINTGSNLRLVYLGLMEQPRGIGTALDGVAEARRRGLPVTLDLIGDGRERVRFEAQAAALGLNDVVRFHGYIAYKEALNLVNAADVGLVPHFANDSWNSTIPNKLFDYMAAGLPVLTSTAIPSARLVKETDSGEIFHDRDAGSFAGALEVLAASERRRICGKAGRKAVQEKYNWERDATHLVAALDSAMTTRT